MLNHTIIFVHVVTDSLSIKNHFLNADIFLSYNIRHHAFVVCTTFVDKIRLVICLYTLLMQ